MGYVYSAEEGGDLRVAGFGRKAVYCALILTSISMSGCSSFGSYGQQTGFGKISVALKKSAKEQPDSATGVLVIFNTNDKRPTVVTTAAGPSSLEAMLTLIRAGDPCRVTGAKPAIAGYAPPLTVDLPFEFRQCAELRDEARVLASQAKALSRLTVSAKGNEASLDQLAKDIAAIADAQDKSWDEVTAMLAEMSGHPKANGSGN